MVRFNRWQKRAGGKKNNKYKPFRNKFEYDVSKTLGSTYRYEEKTDKLNFSVPKTYLPDFVHVRFPWLILEAKGIFIEQSDASKYLHIARCNPDKAIVFIFDNPKAKKNLGGKPRKDGSFLTVSEWATNNNFVWFSKKAIPGWLFSSTITEQDLARKLTRRFIEQQRQLRGVTHYGK